MKNSPSSQTYRIASLFAGAGGMDLGLEKAGFKVVWANDFDFDACETYKMWSDAEVVHGDVAKIDFTTVPDVDVIVGGFPCQGFSLAGPRKIDDSRNSLYKHFVRAVEEKAPLAFIAENVKGILTLGGGQILEAIVSEFSERGYDVSYQLLNAADYGVPQNRERVFLIGVQKGIEAKYKFPEVNLNRVSLKDALYGLPEPEEEDVCVQPFSSRFMSRNRLRGWDKVSYTIPAMAKQVPLHPSSPAMTRIDKDHWEFGEGVTRRFSWQEAALIQTFPKGMEFYGNLVSKYRQIGNAVPVLLAYHVGKELLSVLDSHFQQLNRFRIGA